MFIPLFLAILLGLVNPSTTNNATPNDGTVVNTQSNPDDDGGGNNGDPDDDGNDGTGGDGGHLPPKKP